MATILVHHLLVKEFPRKFPRYFFNMHDGTVRVLGCGRDEIYQQDSPAGKKIQQEISTWFSKFLGLRRANERMLNHLPDNDLESRSDPV